jgi:hypothetical protein
MDSKNFIVVTILVTYTSLHRKTAKGSYLS